MIYFKKCSGVWTRHKNCSMISCNFLYAPSRNEAHSFGWVDVLLVAWELFLGSLVIWRWQLWEMKKLSWHSSSLLEVPVIPFYAFLICALSSTQFLLTSVPGKKLLLKLGTYLYPLQQLLRVLGVVLWINACHVYAGDFRKLFRNPLFNFR